MKKKCPLCKNWVDVLWDRIVNGKRKGVCEDCKDYYERP